MSMTPGKFKHLPIGNPRPDRSEFIDILMGRKPQANTPLVEYIIDDVVRKPIVTQLLGGTWTDYGGDPVNRGRYLDNFIQVWYQLGYDFVKFENDAGFIQHRLSAKDPAPGSTGNRDWMDEHRGFITSRESFERYPWPDVAIFDFFEFEYIDSHLPEGMGLITSHGGGIFEHVSWLMSYEGLCLALYDDPALVRAVTDRVGDILLKFYSHLLQMDNVIAILQGDDMGFKTAPLIAPDHLRTYFIPWHKRFAELTHQRGIPYFLHSCGNVMSLMDDLIGVVGIDGKHSFEDVVLPVEEFQARFGDRIAVLGGLDINILAGKPEDDVRRKTRTLIETCGGRGRYAVGSGNSIPSYVPVENFLAMVDETHKCNGR